MGCSRVGAKASEPQRELIAPGRIKSLSRIDCTGSHGRFMEAFCLDMSVCDRHHSVFHEDKWWIAFCFGDAEHAENSAPDLATNDSIRSIEIAALAGRGGTRMGR